MSACPWLSERCDDSQKSDDVWSWVRCQWKRHHCSDAECECNGCYRDIIEGEGRAPPLFRITYECHTTAFVWRRSLNEIAIEMLVYPGPPFRNVATEACQCWPAEVER